MNRYNALVRETLDRLIPEAPAQLVHVAIEHRLMHAETFAYLLHGLDYDRKAKGRFALPSRDREEALPAWIDVPAGTAVLGRPANDGFGWDNEFREYSVDVPAFTIGKYKVTNREYLDFVRQGGSAPHFWVERDGAWLYHGMFGEIAARARCPGVRDARAGGGLCQWAGGAAPHRAAVAPRGRRRAAGGQPGLPRMGPGGGECHARRGQPMGRLAIDRQRLGMDLQRV